jgi:hypothetical protein
MMRHRFNEWYIRSNLFIRVSPAPISLVKQIPTATYFSFILVDVRSVAPLSLSRSASYLFIPPLPQRDTHGVHLAGMTSHRPGWIPRLPGRSKSPCLGEGHPAATLLLSLWWSTDRMLALIRRFDRLGRVRKCGCISVSSLHSHAPSAPALVVFSQPPSPFLCYLHLHHGGEQHRSHSHQYAH